MGIEPEVKVRVWFVFGCVLVRVQLCVSSDSVQFVHLHGSGSVRVWLMRGLQLRKFTTRKFTTANLKVHTLQVHTNYKPIIPVVQ